MQFYSFILLVYQVQHSEQHVPVEPFRKRLSVTEVFGNEEKENQVTCGRFHVDGGDPVIAEVPFDGFAVILEGMSIILPYSKGGTLC